VDLVGCILAGAVAHPRLADLERAGPGEDGALRQMAVPHDATADRVVAEVVEVVRDLGYFEFEGPLEELPGAFTDESRTGSGRATVGCVPSDMGRTFSLEL
jgi:hypothetical protein